MVIISYYLKSVCLRDSLSLVRPDPASRPYPVYSLASCYCFCRSVSMNSPFRVRLRARAPASASPRPGLPAVPVIPLFPFGGAKVHLFFEPPNFFGKIFRKVFFPAASVPSASLARPPRSRETGPQKYCFFTIRQTFFQEIFEKIFNPLTVNIKKTPEFSSIHPRNAAPDSKTHPPPHRNYSRFRASISNCSLHFPSSQT